MAKGVSKRKLKKKVRTPRGKEPLGTYHDRLVKKGIIGH